MDGGAVATFVVLLTLVLSVPLVALFMRLQQRHVERKQV